MKNGSCWTKEPAEASACPFSTALKQWPWFLLSLFVILIDQASKYWVLHSFTAYEPINLLPVLNISLAYNTGASFGFLSQAGEWHKWFFAGFNVLMSVVLAIWLGKIPPAARLQSAGISLILGGALGNLIDRGLHAQVIDFIDFYYKTHHFATFNLADAAICVGALLFLLGQSK
jgi:signal peptidase II